LAAAAEQQSGNTRARVQKIVEMAVHRERPGAEGARL
jgi:hypothetical protein